VLAGRCQVWIDGIELKRATAKELEGCSNLVGTTMQLDVSEITRTNLLTKELQTEILGYT